MNDLTTSLILQLRNDQFSSGLRMSTRNVEQFSRQSQREIRTLKQSFKNMTGNYLGDLKRDLLAVGSTWALINQSKRSGQLDKDLTRITQTAGVTRSETKKLKEEIFGLQRQIGVGIGDSQKAMDILVQSGLNWNQALGGTKAIAPATAVTGANPEVLAGAMSVSSEIFGFDLSKKGVATDLLDTMMTAGRTGKAELEDLSGIVSKVGANAKQAGMSFNQMLGFVEQLSRTQPQPELLGTLADSTLRTFTNQQYMKSVTEKLGVKFFDSKGARRDNFKVWDDLAKIYQRQKTDEQRQAVISIGWGQADLDTQKGVKAMLAPGAIDAMRQKTDITSKGKGAIAAGLDEAIDNSIDQVSRLKGALGEAADSFVTPFNSGINAGIKKLLNTKENGGLGWDGTDLAVGGGLALAGGVAAYKFGGPLMKKLLGGAGNVAGGVATGKALEAATGVIPVYVVNMPSTGTSIIDGLIGGGKRTLKIPKLPNLSSVGSIIEAETKTAKALKTMGKFGKFGGPAVAATVGSIGAYNTWTSDKSTSEKVKDTVGIAGGVGGSVAGGWIGALALSWIPIIGPPLGYAIGGAIGYTVGDKVASQLANVSLDNGMNDNKPAPRMAQKHEQSTLSFIEAMKTSLDSHADQKHNNRRQRAQQQREESRAQAELKVTVEDKRTKVTSVTSSGMDLDIAGHSMGGM